jgi:integrase
MSSTIPTLPLPCGAAMADNLIQKRGESTWYVRLAVPADIQRVIGYTVLIQSLKTGLRKEAMNARLPYLTQWKAAFAMAREQVGALKENWRPELASRIQELDSHTGQRFLIAAKSNPTVFSGTREEADVLAQRIVDRIEAIYRSAFAWEADGVPGVVALTDKYEFWKISSNVEHVQKADAYKRDLTKLVTAFKYNLTPAEAAEANAIVRDPTTYKPKSPINLARLKAFREFRSSRGGKAKHVDTQVSRMEHLSAFLKKEGLPLNFDTVDEWLKSLNRAPATLGQYLMAGTAFWKWATTYDSAWRDEYKDKVDPFKSHELHRGGGSETAGESREIYTPADARKLYQAAIAKKDEPLADLILLAWHTGGRIEELCQLRIDNVITVDGIRCFDFPKSKSKSSKRVVPIHPELVGTVDRLVAESNDTYLIPTTSVNQYGKRSHAISKAFGRLRTGAGFSALHVFHSFRHTVVTELVRADVPDALTKELVGHETGSVTHDVYSKGGSAAQKLAAISKLPSLRV